MGFGMKAVYRGGDLTQALAMNDFCFLVFSFSSVGLRCQSSFLGNLTTGKVVRDLVVWFVVQWVPVQRRYAQSKPRSVGNSGPL
jgi:hypothetical protein